MGCVNSSPIIIVRSMETFKKESRKYLEQQKNEDLNDKDFTFSDEIEDDTSPSSQHSQIPIKAKMEDNELIFL